ncbi:MAG: hypothetical protein CFE24_15265 [Flavobacterium sp. BFFFF2]|nr:MAG: hypothetical protein CFE24_15265 [Flavobacterium sp. BFFFF2]
MYNCLDYADLNGFEKQVKEYLKSTDESSASLGLATFIIKEYRAERADTVAKLMEIIIRCNPALALINYPENHFFRIIMISGSMDLFECLTEEAIEPHLKNSSEEEYIDYYTKLLHLGAKLNTIFSDQYEPQIKGVHFNGRFGTDDSNPNIALINLEDYEMMNDIIDKFNSIIGRRDIIKALMTKVGMKF